MSTEIVTALIAFAFASSITPGPNNLMLLASGANFGLRRTVPHMLGVSLGHAFMIVLVGAGLMGVFDAYPVAYTILKVVSVAYLLFLTWKIVTAGAPRGDSRSGTPMTFLQAAAFQWVNPKGWAMALTAISSFWITSFGVVGPFSPIHLLSVVTLVGLDQPAIGQLLGVARQTGAEGADEYGAAARVQHHHGRAADRLALPGAAHVGARSAEPTSCAARVAPA